MREVAWFSQLCDDIRSLKIQGAEHVARAAVEGVARLMAELPGEDLTPYVRQLLATRPTEPMMRNAVAFFLSRANSQNGARVLEYTMGRLDEADEKIAAYAGGLIKDGAVYFTHCHSSTVTAALVRARKEGKRFTVHNTETRPLYQGRITAQELAAAGIPVVHYVDSAARVALKGCVAVLLGADALLADAKVANKIGSEMVAELASSRAIPVYVLASSWKYDPATSQGYKELLEQRLPEEVWDHAPNGVKVQNDAFELVMPKYVTAIITEHGIRDPVSAIAEIRKRGVARIIDDKTD
jgi:ribose 1,5-bisphosphate isomerase